MSYHFGLLLFFCGFMTFMTFVRRPTARWMVTVTIGAWIFAFVVSIGLANRPAATAAPVEVDAAASQAAAASSGSSTPAAVPPAAAAAGASDLPKEGLLPDGQGVPVGYWLVVRHAGRLEFVGPFFSVDKYGRKVAGSDREVCKRNILRLREALRQLTGSDPLVDCIGLPMELSASEMREVFESASEMREVFESAPAR